MKGVELDDAYFNRTVMVHLRDHTVLQIKGHHTCFFRHDEFIKQHVSEDGERVQVSRWELHLLTDITEIGIEDRVTPHFT